MSYDLVARHDDSFLEKLPREYVYELIAGMPNMKPNGDSGFVFQKGETAYMEIDIEFVSEEGDNIEDDLPADESEVNCINFYIPYGFSESLGACIAIAKEVSQKINWQLIDLQAM